MVNRGNATKNGEPYTPNEGEVVNERDGDPLVWDGTQFVEPDDYKVSNLLDRNVGMQEEQLAAQLEISEAEIEIAQAVEARASEEYDRYKELYLPGEIGFVKASFEGIPVEQELAWASSGVNQSFDSALQAAAREMQGYGVDPSSPKFAQMTSDFALAKAAADAGARNAARKDVRDTNYERRRQATMIGRNIPASSSGISSDAASAYSGASTALASGYNAAGGALLDSAKLTQESSLAQEKMQNDADIAKWGAIGQIGGGVAEAGAAKLFSL